MRWTIFALFFGCVAAVNFVRNQAGQLIPQSTVAVQPQEVAYYQEQYEKPNHPQSNNQFLQTQIDPYQQQQQPPQQSQQQSQQLQQLRYNQQQPQQLQYNQQQPQQPKYNQQHLQYAQKQPKYVQSQSPQSRSPKYAQQQPQQLQYAVQQRPQYVQQQPQYNPQQPQQPKYNQQQQQQSEYEKQILLYQQLERDQQLRSARQRQYEQNIRDQQQQQLLYQQQQLEYQQQLQQQQQNSYPNQNEYNPSTQPVSYPNDKRRVVYPGPHNTTPANPYAQAQPNLIQQQSYPSSTYRIPTGPQIPNNNIFGSSPVQGQSAVRPVAPVNNGNPVYQAPISNPHERFSTKLYSIVSAAHAPTNIVYSPLSLQTLLAFVYIGATGQTAQQLQRALELPEKRDEVAQLFHNLVERHQQNTGETKIIVASKLYHKPNVQVTQNLNQYAQYYFDAELEPIDFSQSRNAVPQINNWVARKTQNAIRSAVSPGSLDPRTQAILVNAIYFKAKWVKEFSAIDTETQKFYISPQVAVPVNMMYNDDVFKYGDFPDLQAKVLEMKYKGPDELSMMIILPYEVNGLSKIESRLSNTDLSTLAAQLMPETVTVRIPKFKMQFELDMLPPLKSLGITKVFANNAELTEFFPNEPMQISKVQHKAHIEVNEAGSEAAAASFTKFIPLALPAKLTTFTADHPFMFAIRSPQAVYFIGHVVRL